MVRPLTTRSASEPRPSRTRPDYMERCTWLIHDISKKFSSPECHVVAMPRSIGVIVLKGR